MPEPRSGEILVKVMAAPLNPSDMYMLKGFYDEGECFKITYPIVPGWEGSGVVVKSGGGFMGWKLLGKRISFVRKNEGAAKNEMHLGGCYQQYIVTDPLACIVLPDDMPFTIGSMHFVNPLTAMGLVQRVKDNGSQAAIQTAAASQCGRMVIKICHQENIPLINVVRKDE